MEQKPNMVPIAIHSSRKKGSGRPEGSYMLGDDVVELVKSYLNYSQTAAHERRRDDVARFGGVGSGLSWERHITDFVNKPFFSDSNVKKASKSTVRRLGLAPSANRKAAVRQIIPFLIDMIIKTFHYSSDTIEGSLQQNQPLQPMWGSWENSIQTVTVALQQ